MLKKLFIYIFPFFLISQCGFAPMYSEKSDFNQNIFINSIEFEGDRKLNKYLEIYLSEYISEKKDNGFNIKLITNYNKEVIAKDKTAKTTNYKLSSVTSVQVSQKGKTIKEFSIKEQNNMENMSDKFEEQKYENDTKQNFASTISDKLISELVLLNDN